MQNVTLKVILVGDSRVGKSQLCRRITNRPFEERAQTTVGMEFAKRSFDFEKSVVMAQVWSTAGEDRYDGMMRSFYRNAAACVLVYDIGCRDSFLNIRKVWLKNVQTQGSDDLRLILVGNKMDISDKQHQSHRQVSIDEGIELAKQLNVDFVETSALTGQGVECAFRRVVLSVAMKIPQISIHLEVSYLPHGWMMASSPMALTTVQSDSHIVGAVDTEYSVMHACNAVSINGTSSNCSSSNNNLSHSSSSGPNSISSFSISLSSVDRQERKSVAYNKTPNRYINYWTGAETNELPLAYAPTGLLFVQKEVKKRESDRTSFETAPSSESTSSTRTVRAMSITKEADPPRTNSLSESKKRNLRTSRCGNRCCVIA